MSLDLWVSCFRNGEPHPEPTALLRAPFDPLVVSTEPRCLVLGLPGGQESLLYIDTTANAETGFTLNRPVRDPALWLALFSALRHTGRVLVVPGEVPPLIGVADTAPHLPADMVETLGQPVVVTDGLAIRHWVENA
jgi:hypothetical protein